jgi:hypothetical protein
VECIHVFSFWINAICCKASARARFLAAVTYHARSPIGFIMFLVGQQVAPSRSWRIFFLSSGKLTIAVIVYKRYSGIGRILVVYYIDFAIKRQT